MKNKCFSCGRRRKYGVEAFVYRKSFFRKIKRYFVCYPCVSGSE